MSLSADILLDRKKLKEQATRWRLLALLFIALLAIAQLQNISGTPHYLGGDYIARINVTDFIAEDSDRDAILDEIAKDKHIKAVILHIDSPGGTVVGGEMLYDALRRVAKVKPLVATLGTVAASGGYMTAIAADYIVSQYNTITGSVGVILQTAEITDLASKLGINLITIKSGKLKAIPSPFEKLTPEGQASINDSIKESFNYFVTLVTKRRHLPDTTVSLISDGRIFTGGQAATYHLVDAIGGEEEARKWLANTRKIPETLDVKEVLLHKKKPFWQEYTNSLIGNNILSSRFFSLDGLLAIWHPL